LEEYIYEARDKIDGQWASFMPAGDKDGFRSQLTAAEDWLYSEEGEDATKSAYVEKLDSLKKVGDPVAFRFRETEERPRALKAIRESVVDFMTKATSGDEKYSHLSEEDLQKVIEKCANTQKWLDDMGARQAEKRKDEKPAFTSTEVNKRREEVEYFCRPIINKPKPKAKTEAPKKEETKAPETNGDEEMPELETADGEAAKPDMDVD
jgi:heat shock protein 4